MSDNPETEENPFLKAFADPAMVAHYATEGPARFLPGLNAVHRITAAPLRERTASDAHVLGAGGGLKLDALAKAELCLPLPCTSSIGRSAPARCATSIGG